MPAFRRKYKSKPRRPMKRRRYGKGKRMVLKNTALHPFAQRFITKMKYSETVSTNASGLFSFNLNSINDPNRSGVGHQPYGHDTLQTIYNRYRVIACSYRVTIAAGASPVMLACLPANEVLNYTTNSEFRENPRCRYTIANTGAGASTVSGKVYLPSLVGQSPGQYKGEDRYQAIMGNNPVEVAVLNLKTSTIADVDTSATLNVTLEYVVELFDPKHISQS